MKKSLILLAFILVLSLSAFTSFNSMQWKIADGYSIKFSSENPSGAFETFNGTITFDENHPEASKFDVDIDAASIKTGNGMKNRHAKSKKWFDVKTFPTIKFTSDKISKTGNGYEVTGTLDMHGVQKQITFPFTFQNKTFTGSFMINRLDYKVGTTEGMSANAQTNLKVDISVPVTP